MQPLSLLPNLCRSKGVLVLVLVCELLAIALVTGESGLRHFNWERLAMVSFMVQWVSLSSAAVLCILRKRLLLKSAYMNVAVSYTAVLLVALLVATCGQILLFDRSLATLDGWQILESLLVTAIFAGIALRYFYLQWQLESQRQAELHSRIQALQSRIRPHFLFNSMNSIASLIEVDPETAERVVEDLSELFRASLAEPNLIPLKRELELAYRYLKIEQLRMGERLQLDWRVPDLPEQATIPSMLLQPLLENAIYHGVQPSVEGGCVHLAVAVNDDAVSIVIRNPLQEGVEAKSGNGIALDNIRHRLGAYYGAQGTLQLGRYGGEYVVRLNLPLAVELNEGEEG